MKRRFWALALLIALLSAASAFAAAPQTGEFSSFGAADINGASVNQDVILSADLTVMNVWGTFCGPCLREMPALGKLAKEYEAKNVRFVGVVIDVLDRKGNVVQSQVEKAKSLVARTGADYLHLLPSEDLLKAKLSQVYAIPETYFVDSDGVIVDTVTGAMSEAQWREKIDSVLSRLKK